MTMQKDYLSYVSIGGGCSYGYGETPAEAVFNMLCSLKDWTMYYDLSEVNVYSSIYDVREYAGFSSDHRGVFGSNDDGTYSDEPLEPIQFSRTLTPKHTRDRNWGTGKAANAALRTVFGDKFEVVDLDAVA